MSVGRAAWTCALYSVIPLAAGWAIFTRRDVARRLREYGEGMTESVPSVAEASADSRRWLGLAALTTGVAMIIVDATIVNVAIPSIIRDLRIGITQASGRTRSTRSCSPRS